MGDLTANFSRSEFECQCGCGKDTIDWETLDKLQKLRVLIGLPIKVTSALRCEHHNKMVGGSKNSYHLDGRATDIVCNGIDSETLAEKAEMVGFNGIGVYDTFVHVDTRSYKARWRG